MKISIVVAGKEYSSEEASSCDKCAFYWRDGGIYDVCDHPDQSFVKITCGREMREEGKNIHWIAVKDEQQEVNARDTTIPATVAALPEETSGDIAYRFRKRLLPREVPELRKFYENLHELVDSRQFTWKILNAFGPSSELSSKSDLKNMLRFELRFDADAHVRTEDRSKVHWILTKLRDVNVEVIESESLSGNPWNLTPKMFNAFYRLDQDGTMNGFVQGRFLLDVSTILPKNVFLHGQDVQLHTLVLPGCIGIDQKLMCGSTKSMFNSGKLDTYSYVVRYDAQLNPVVTLEKDE